MISADKVSIKYLSNKDRPWKYQNLADAMKEIVNEDEYYDTSGRIRMYQALLLKQDFHSDAPLEKCITNITKIPTSNEELYVSAIFNCFNLSVLGPAMGTNTKTDLCIQTLENALTAYLSLEGAIIYSDRETQYTSESYRQTIQKHHIHQSMNSAGVHCHDNACCKNI